MIKMMEEKNIPSTYAEAGIDLSVEARVLRKINHYVKKSFSFGEVVSKENHYANLIKVGEYGIALASDGVGTKILVALSANRYDSIGIDCVAMNVNDLLSMGILPKAFVDYLAVSNLDENIIEEIIKGVYKGCEIAKIPILGGELATIPEMLSEKDNSFDLAGTALGIVSLDEVIDGSKIELGDLVLGISSSGIHSNGFTIARKVLGIKYELSDELPWGKTLYEELLIPTRIYTEPVKELLKECEVHGLAHITGSGFKKLFRITKYGFELDQLPEPTEIFEEIRKLGNISYHEMYSVFNMGVGFVVVIPKKETERAINLLNKYFETQIIGEIVENPIISIPQKDVVFSR
jgi:phosphoribosylformylglycinamidine cyclo-ligase